MNMIKTRNVDERVIVATHGSGVFSNGVPAESPVSVDLISKNKTELSVYPNPCRDWLRIENVDLISGESYLIRIFDLQGKLMAEQPIACRQAGQIQVDDALNRLNSGVYVVDVTGTLSGKVLGQLRVRRW